ncbi:transcriptional regulator [Streptococcus sp. NLN64]|uniref:helix-turn-helix transcriptional regulator n=1 Tax=Streptococcus sp. NLN64 TaxID=2822799 RepID=UPI0018CAEFFD|nr:transcriptional regulator [Streptococcus sp. NLN64]MBG9368279.1 transcriptional regulator [Streptococcus sp. NLN64]
MSKLKGYRVMLGQTQASMAKTLGVSTQSYNNKETGKTPFSNSEMLKIRDMVRAIEPNITIDDLFFS